MNLHAGSVVVKPVTWRSRFLYVHTHARVCHSRRERGRNLGASGATRNNESFSETRKRVSANHVPRSRVEREQVVRHQWIHVFLSSKAREENVLARQRVASAEAAVSNAFP